MSLTAASGTPFGSFDTPLNNTTGIAGAIPVTGWALDNIGVTSVGIYRDRIGGETPGSNGLVFVGDAIFVPERASGRRINLSECSVELSRRLGLYAADQLVAE